MKINRLKFEENVRSWSNREIKRALEPLKNISSVVNISGFDDRDKDGGYYRDYFQQNAEYFITYYPGDNSKGQSGACCTGTIAADLMEPIPECLIGRFNLVFNHTVLEHVPNPFIGFENISRISTDLVLTVVPFRQQLHFIPGDFGDYFRITPQGMRYLNEINGLTTLYENTTPSPTGAVYIVSLATKKPEIHSAYPVRVPDINELNNIAGRHSFADSVAHVANTALRRVRHLVGRDN